MSVYTKECELYYTFQYSLNGVKVTDYEVLKALGRQAQAKKNFDVAAVNCDADGSVYPDGHWIGLESNRGSNDFVKGGVDSDGGFVMNCQSSNNVCCKDDLIGDRLPTGPLLDKVCGSINTGGGIFVGYSTNELLVGPEGTYFCS